MFFKVTEPDGDTTLDIETITNYMQFLELPLKFVACWDWFKNPKRVHEVLANYIYLGFVLCVLGDTAVSLVHLRSEQVDVMDSLREIADGLPLVASGAIVVYFALYKKDLYELVEFLNAKFKSHSARGLSNMTMVCSHRAAGDFARRYTACTLFSVTIYVTMPVVAHLWTKQPLQPWVYKDVTTTWSVVFVFLKQCLSQAFVALALGQLGVFFASNAILVCGQTELACCSLRNARHSALLRRGLRHAALAGHRDMLADERHNYIYNRSELKDSRYNYDVLSENVSAEHTTMCDVGEAEAEALRECAHVCRAVARYGRQLEAFVSPLLALRVVQVTLYLCVLLYAATEKLDTVTAEYLAAVALDIFVYCYFGHQIILQADRVSTAAYQSGWPEMGPRARKLLLNILLASRRPMVIRAGRFLPMDLRTFVLIIKTSFSYYTLLASVNET